MRYNESCIYCFPTLKLEPSPTSTISHPVLHSTCISLCAYRDSAATAAINEYEIVWLITRSKHLRFEHWNPWYGSRRSMRPSTRRAFLNYFNACHHYYTSLLVLRTQCSFNLETLHQSSFLAIGWTRCPTHRHFHILRRLRHHAPRKTGAPASVDNNWLSSYTPRRQLLESCPQMLTTRLWLDRNDDGLGNILSHVIPSQDIRDALLERARVQFGLTTPPMCGHSTIISALTTTSCSKEDEDVLKAEYIKNPKPDKAARLDIVSKVALGEKEVQVCSALPIPQSKCAHQYWF